MRYRSPRVSSHLPSYVACLPRMSSSCADCLRCDLLTPPFLIRPSSSCFLPVVIAVSRLAYSYRPAGSHRPSPRLIDTLGGAAACLVLSCRFLFLRFVMAPDTVVSRGRMVPSLISDGAASPRACPCGTFMSARRGITVASFLIPPACLPAPVNLGVRRGGSSLRLLLAYRLVCLPARSPLVPSPRPIDTRNGENDGALIACVADFVPIGVM